MLLDEEPGGAALTGARGSADRVALAVGPEGGWTGEEREKFLASGWKAVSLGQQVLRAETAGIAGLAVLQA